MSRSLILGILSLAFVGSALAADPIRTIDLNDADALSTLKEKNPAHYQAVEKILADVTRIPDASVKKWLQVEFNAKDAQYGLAILTSYPPKKNLSFTLDDTRYRAQIVLHNAKPKLVPAK